MKSYFLTLPSPDVESSSDVALYSGLAAGVVTVVLLIIAVTLYRRSQSEYGVDVIDSSALTGGFQSFSFKTSRQGEPLLFSYKSRYTPNTYKQIPEWCKERLNPTVNIGFNHIPYLRSNIDTCIKAVETSEGRWKIRFYNSSYNNFPLTT